MPAEPAMRLVSAGPRISDRLAPDSFVVRMVGRRHAGTVDHPALQPTREQPRRGNVERAAEVAAGRGDEAAQNLLQRTAVDEAAWLSVACAPAPAGGGPPLAPR